MVTHQLQYLKDIDDKENEVIYGPRLTDSRIIMLRTGKIIAQGTYKEMENNSIYKEFSQSLNDVKKNKTSDEDISRIKKQELDLLKQKKLLDDINVDELFLKKYNETKDEI